jgi:hypothetical protein
LAGGRPAVVVPGNHDRYCKGPGDGRPEAELVATMREEAARLGERTSNRVVILEGGERASVAGITFVGATLWTDWSLAGLWRPELTAPAATAAAMASVTHPSTGSREYHGAIIREGGEIWSPRDAFAQHRREREAMHRALTEAAAGAEPVVAVTHHAPLTSILEPYRHHPGVPWWIPAFYASTLLPDLPDDIRPDFWVSGHFHAAHDEQVGRTRWVANPVAAADFNPERIITIPSRSTGSG